MAVPAGERTIVLVHGIGGAARAWAGTEAALRKVGWRTLAIDLPGYGGRSLPNDLTFEALAEDVEELIKQAGLASPVLVGHSLGGMVVQTMLRRRYRGYLAAVLACTSPAFGSPAGDFQKKFVADRLAPLDAGRSMRDLAAGMVAGMMGPSPDPAGCTLALDMMAATPAETYRAAVRCVVGFDERANLGKIGIPVLCLACELDRNAPAAMMQRMAEKIPGARYVCLPGVGHLPNLEAPAAFEAAVLEFLADLRGGRPT